MVKQTYSIVTVTYDIHHCNIWIKIEEKDRAFQAGAQKQNGAFTLNALIGNVPAAGTIK